MPKGTKATVIGHYKHFTCECGYETRSETGIRLHKRVTHGTNSNDLDRDADVHRCKICRKTFDTKFQLLTHCRHAGHAAYQKSAIWGKVGNTWCKHGYSGLHADFVK